MLCKGGDSHMDDELENKMIEFMRPMFGDMAEKTIENQMNKLGVERESLTREDSIEVAQALSDLCSHMAGEAIAHKIHIGLIEILES